MEQIEIEAMLEAVLFAHADPIGPEKLAAVLELPQSLVARGLEGLQKRYHWQLATKNQYGPWVRKALETRKAVPLSNAAMETLTVIAYNQPVSRAFIEQVRGVDSSSSVSGLLEKGLIEEAGRLDLPGRPVSFRTTDHFLRVFGLSSLADLPPVRPEDEGKEGSQ